MILMKFRKFEAVNQNEDASDAVTLVRRAGSVLGAGALAILAVGVVGVYAFIGGSSIPKADSVKGTAAVKTVSAADTSSAEETQISVSQAAETWKKAGIEEYDLVIETVKATEILAKEGFVVLPYMYPDLNVARSLRDAGAAAIMPLGSPIGSNKGIATKEFIKIIINEIDLPVIVDAGIGRPSQACEAMEMGAAAVMSNTAIATAGDIPMMANAFKKAIEAGRQAYLSGLGRVIENGASASSPLTGFLES